MAINKYMQSALKVLSHIDIKKNYKLIRKAQQAAKKSHIKLDYKTWNYYINNGDYKIPIRVYSPDKNEIVSFADTTYPLIVFFHGGGWVTENIDTYEKTCLTIAAQTSHMVVAVDYRLAPENPFPTALEDCRKVVQAVMRWNKISKSHRKIILMGDSAGANLAAALSLYMRDKGEEIADKQILIYPVTYNNHTDASPFPSVKENGTDYILTSKHICDYLDMYCATEADRNNPYCAPLLAEDFSNQPDTLLITAEYDPLRDEGEAYGYKLRDAGNFVLINRIKNALHGYFSLSIKYTQVKKTYALINQFLWEGSSSDEKSGKK